MIWFYKIYKGSPDVGANNPNKSQEYVRSQSSRADKGCKNIVGEGAIVSNRSMSNR